MGRELRRRTPEECLLEVQAEEAAAVPKGHLKVFLGYASGAGKSFRMLDEARRRSERRQRILVGAVQPRVSREVAEVLEKLDVIPLKSIGGGTAMDIDAILKRCPTVCVVDGLAYDNPPGSRNATRWQDVQELMGAGIKVIGSINIQYVDEVSAAVEAITGKHVTETVPMSFIESADEIEIVDAPTVELSESGDEREKFAKLRELALHLAADVVEHQLSGYLDRHGIHQHFGTHERILICVTPRANVGGMLEAAKIVVDRFHAELIAAHVKQPFISAADQEALDERLAMARAAGARAEILEGDDPARALLDFARVKGVTQIYVGHSQRTGLSRFRSGPLDKLIWESRGMDVRVFPNKMLPNGRGSLKIFMGYAAGVGKTYKMLEEAQELKRAGVDVVVGYFEPHGRKETIAQTEGLELIPRQKIEYRGTIFDEMDTQAILRRHPRVCLVDEFPHTNVPGMEWSKRWEDVEVLLAAGTDVLTTMNIQHLESLNDQVWQITGIRVRETIPDWVVQQAHEVVMVDLTPRALLHRLERGVVYQREKAESAMRNFFREGTLVALRELALRQAAHEVEQRIGVEPMPVSGRHHKILVLVTPNPKSAMLIRRAKRVGDFIGAECFAVVVTPTGDLSGLAESDREAAEQHLNFARNLHIETRILEGDDVAETLVDFGRRNQVTQIYVTRPSGKAWLPGLFQDPSQKIVGIAKDMQVVIVSDREPVSE